jgi:hypothetical protein
MFDWLSAPLCLVAVALIIKGWPSIKIGEKHYHYYNDKGEEIISSSEKNENSEKK